MAKFILLYRIRLGLCCINTELRSQKPPVFCSRTVIRKNFTLDKARSLALQNVKDLLTMIEWNEKHKISLFRISSDIFPHFTDREIEPYIINFAHAGLKRAGDLAKKYGHRILMHPGQYNQVGTPREEVFKATISDLAHHADILDAMGMGSDGIIIVHGGGTFGDKSTTKKRWVEQFKKLPLNVRKRLVLENCEKGYSPRDCLDICQEIKIPMVYDCFHYECYKILHPDEEHEDFDDFIPEVLKTWESNDLREAAIPLMHVSEQGEGKIGHHSNFVENIPDHMLEIPWKYDVDLDIEIEAKMKEQAIFHLYKKYGDFK
jgi:UV DNA damage endonuclease